MSRRSLRAVLCFGAAFLWAGFETHHFGYHVFPQSLAEFGADMIGLGLVCLGMLK